MDDLSNVVEIEPAEGAAGGQAESWRRRLLLEVERLNKRSFVVDLGGKIFIGSYVRDDVLGRSSLVFYKSADFVLKFKNRRVQTGVTTRKALPIIEDLGTAWIAHYARRSYERAAMLPGKQAPAGVLNLWRGWGIEPKPGDCKLILAHLREVVCDGHEGNFRYLMGWLARAVQRPDKQGEVAVVMRGLKGTGKSTLGKIMARIFGDHSLQIFSSKHHTGHFNGHLGPVSS